MPLLDILTIYVLMLAVMVLLGALKALYTAKALGRNRVEVAVNEHVPLLPDAPDRLAPAFEHARGATKQAAA
ncbi:hypothetical protein ABIE89_002304 [Bradyrhizobium niftali]|uniref:hypothetical protein n=1 Tax=Bradyrhizobium niftali TaxID=2560055 RepID=UPI003833400F